MLCAMCLSCLCACGPTNVNINDYLIENRVNLFTAQDDLYSLTLSTGTRETNYNFDGVIDEMCDFGILTLSRNDNSPLAKDTYTYTVRIGEENYTGILACNEIDNTYSADIGINISSDSVITAQVSFTGYTFSKELTNISNSFAVDNNTAINIANKELEKNISTITRDKNNKIEVITKILKDYSTSDLKKYYWYIGVISTKGETLGVLIDSSNGDIIAKKV